jgi:hypothetical protein
VLGSGTARRLASVSGQVHPTAWSGAQRDDMHGFVKARRGRKALFGT